MKHILSFSLLASIFLCSFSYTNPPVEETKETVKWYSWEEAIKANETEKKKFIIDIYTDWCGWCKKMDKTTFADPKVAAYLNENFYPVKLNAEQKEEIEFDGQTFEYIANGRRGVHGFAYALLDGRLGYPAFVYLNESYERIMISPGFKKEEDIMPELIFTAQEHYKTQSWDDYFKTKK